MVHNERGVGEWRFFELFTLLSNQEGWGKKNEQCKFILKQFLNKIVWVC